MAPEDEKMQRILKMERKVRLLRSATLCVLSLDIVVLAYLVVHFRLLP